LFHHPTSVLYLLPHSYHNFHHEFPSDYRNAIIWYQYDPTKWLIFLLSLPPFFQTYSLKTFRSNEIEKGRLQQQQKALNAKRAGLDWGVPLAQLPVIDWDDFQTQCKNGGRMLVAIGGVIHDVSGFVAEHPGGKTLIRSVLGKDANALFNGGVYEHSNAAHNMLATMRVGVLRGGQEVEVWKSQRAEVMKTQIMEHITRVEKLNVAATAA
jgi:stearoyl-CoA desaturase (delta-9 desaturase)